MFFWLAKYVTIKISMFRGGRVNNEKKNIVYFNGCNNACKRNNNNSC